MVLAVVERGRVARSGARRSSLLADRGQAWASDYVTVYHQRLLPAASPWCVLDFSQHRAIQHNLSMSTECAEPLSAASVQPPRLCVAPRSRALEELHCLAPRRRVRLRRTTTGTFATDPTENPAHTTNETQY